MKNKFIPLLVLLLFVSTIWAQKKSSVPVSRAGNEIAVSTQINKNNFAANSFKSATLATAATLVVGPGGYPSIQAAISAAGAGDIIQVTANTWTETGPIVISQNLTIIGADKATTIIKPDANYTSWITVNSGVTLNLSKVTLDGTGRTIDKAILHLGNGIIDDCNFTEIKLEPSGPAYQGTAIRINSTGNVDVTNCTFSQIGRNGILADDCTGTISGNTYTGKGAGNWLDYFILSEYGDNIVISNNNISNNLGVASSDGSGSCAIAVWDDPGTTANISGNIMTNNSIGIAVVAISGGTSDPTVTIGAGNLCDGGDYGISFQTYGVSHSPSVSFIGTSTLKGQTNQAFDISDGVSAGSTFDISSVIFKTAGGTTITDNFTKEDLVYHRIDASNRGLFRWNSNNLYVTQTSGSIQKAIDASSSGNTINVAAGNYTAEGDITINKPLTIIGTGNPTVTKFIYAASPITVTGFGGGSTQTVDVVPGADLDDAVDLVAPGGTINLAPGTYDALTIDKPLTIDGNGTVIINPGSPAITVTSTGVTITGITFNGDFSPFYAVEVENGPYNVTITDCNFLTTPGIVGSALLNKGTGTIDARNNYWFHPTGPTYALNPSGIGNKIMNSSTGSILFAPWWINNPHVNKMTIASLDAPADLSTGISITPQFSWSWPVGITGAPPTGYTIEISTDPAFATGNVFPAPVAATSPYQLLSANALTNSTIYYWRITAAVSGQTPAAAGKFTTIMPVQPALFSPAHVSTITGNIINFMWTAPMGGIKYKVEISSDPSFNTIVTTLPSLISFTTVNYLTYPFTTSMLPAGDYYWRVKTFTAAGSLIGITSGWNFIISGPPTAIPSYPTNITTVYTNSPTIYWYMMNNYYNSGIYYRVRYSTASLAWSTLTNGTRSAATTNNYLTLPGLVPGNTYYYVIDASTAADFSANVTTSIEASFIVFYNNVTLGSIPIYQSYPTAGTIVYTTAPKLYWFIGMIIPGVTFNIELTDLNTAAVLTTITNAVSGYEFTAPPLTAGHNYSWRVRLHGSTTWYGPETFAVNSSSSGSSSSTSASIPTLASPIGGTVVSTQSPILLWTTFSSAPLDYQVIYSSNPAMSIAGSLANGTSTGWLVNDNYTLPGLTPGVTYYWQVRSRLASGSGSPSGYSSVGQFTVSPGASPIVVLPANPLVGSTINSTAANLSWVVPAQSTSILTYDLEISKNKDMSASTLISNLKQPSYSVSSLSSNSKYYWRVRSKNNSGSYSDYSYKGEFSTGSATDAKEVIDLPTEFELSQNYPNPFNPSTAISYQLSANSFVTLKIYDMLGREVKTLVNMEMNAGRYKLNWNGDDNMGNKTASGTYIYRITAGNFVSSKKMILIK